MSMPPTDAIARDALEKIADNIAYMRGEPPGLAPPEDIRAAILSACACFDQTVRRLTLDEPAGALSPLSDALKDMPEGAVLYVYGQDADGLLEAMEAMHDVVMRLGEEKVDHPRLHATYMLVSSVAVGILNAYSIFRAMTDRPAGSAPDMLRREGDFGQVRPAAKRGESE